MSDDVSIRLDPNWQADSAAKTSAVTRLLRSLIMLLLAAMLGWSGIASVDAAEASVSTPTIYTYDSYHRADSLIHATTERVSRATHNRDAAHISDAHRSGGVSARSGDATTPTTCTYDDMERFARTERGSHGAKGPNGSCAAPRDFGQRLQVAAKKGSRFGSLTHAADGIAPYSTQRLITAGHGGEIQAHHLIEKRFADVMGQSTADMSAVVVTSTEHQVFTNQWRQAIPYGSRSVTPSMVNNAARRTLHTAHWDLVVPVRCLV